MLRKITLLVACAAGGGLAAVGACGGDDGGNPDARRYDARETADGPEPDAAVTTYVGTISVLEAELRVASGSGGIFGSGLSIRTAFVDPDEVGTPVFDTTGGTSFGCKVYEYTPAQFAATVGHDLGTLLIEAGDGTPAVPQCGFQQSSGYLCPDTTSSGVGGTIAVAGSGAMTLTDSDTTFTSEAVGRYVNVAGATNAANNGAFPIVQLISANTIAFGNTAGVAETLPDTATHVNIAGAGPIPGYPQGAFMADDDSLTFTFTATSQTNIPSFTGDLTDVGNHFTLNTTSQDYLIDPPDDGSEFTFDCPTEADCGDSIASVVNIQTTDGSLDGLGSYTMPAPETKAVLIRCTSASGGGPSVTIPAEASAYLASSDATRIQTTMVRTNLVLSTTPSTSNLTIIAGASQVGFHTVTPPSLH